MIKCSERSLLLMENNIAAACLTMPLTNTEPFASVNEKLAARRERNNGLLMGIKQKASHGGSEFPR